MGSKRSRPHAEPERKDQMADGRWPMADDRSEKTGRSARASESGLLPVSVTIDTGSGIVGQGPECGVRSEAELSPKIADDRVATFLVGL
jgi:hypothetical protein